MINVQDASTQTDADIDRPDDMYSASASSPEAHSPEAHSQDCVDSDIDSDIDYSSFNYVVDPDYQGEWIPGGRGGWFTPPHLKRVYKRKSDQQPSAGKKLKYED